MRLIVIILLVFISQSCSNTDKSTSKNNEIDKSLIDNGAELTCEENIYDFGEIEQGIPVKHDFIINNVL